MGILYSSVKIIPAERTLGHINYCYCIRKYDVTVSFIFTLFKSCYNIFLIVFAFSFKGGNIVENMKKQSK